MPRLILGHTTDSSIKIWVRASERWPFAFVEVLDSSKQPMGKPAVVATTEEDFYTRVVEWTGLSSATDYRVKVSFGKSRSSKPEEWIRDAYTEGNFRTFPVPTSKAGFTFMLGSCNLHSLGIFEKPDRSWTQISSLARQDAARFMVHCGDQIYADIPLKPSDSLDHYRRKYLDAWDDCVPARKVLTELPHYMILDDHEIINDFDNDMDKGDRDYQGLARIAMKVYWEFQHSHNPGSPRAAHHYHYEFNYGGVPFFVLDTRYYRHSKQGQIIDPEQEADLLAWLTKHASSLKFVVSSIPFVTPVRHSSGDKWYGFQEQRNRILQHVLQQKVSKLVFLTGDMHASCHSQMKVSNKNGAAAVIHELMSSPINQITPDMPLDRLFKETDVDDRDLSLDIQCKIDAKSFYGNHSNVMSIEVPGDGTVSCRIYRTTKAKLTPELKYSFTP